MGNKESRIQALTREIRDLLGDQNVLDALANELAIQRVEMDEFRAQLAGLSNELEVLRTVQRARDIILPGARADYALRQSITMDATAPVAPGTGLHMLEKDGKGTPFRWSGPSPSFQFDLHLDRSKEAVFALHIALWGRERAANLLCTGDDVDIPLASEVGPRALMLTGVLPARETLGVTTLRFTVDAMHTPSVAEGEVPRPLGVPVLRLTAQASTTAEVDRLQMLQHAPSGALPGPAAFAAGK